MKLLFMGTPDFAVPTLQKLAQSGHPLVAVVTAPDKPAGRGQKLTPPAVKVAAQELSIPVLQPENLNDDAFLRTLQQFDADLYVVAAFRILPESILRLPPLGAINLHA
ncbi:MAG: formyltransferase family protein, partial [candidate division KSB1 bacterium]|nr:formyltransferase family protein [candidate division KSB1 bacterium]